MNTRIKFFISIVSLGLCLFTFIFFTKGGISYADATSHTQRPRVSILQIVEHEALNATRKGIEDELLESGKNIDVTYETAQGNPSLAAQIAQKFIGSSPDVVVGIGTTATQSLISSNRQNKIPLIFSSVTDPVGARIVSNLTHPGNHLSGVSNYIEPDRQFTLFKKILPNMERLGIIYNPGEANSVSLMDSMEKAAKQYGIKLIPATANSSAMVADAALSLNNRVDAIFINNDNTALSAFDSIVKIANQNKIPVFVSDTDMVTKGALASLGPDQYALGRQTGRMVLKVLNQVDPGTLPVLFPEKVEFYLNLKASQRLGIKIPASVVQEAAKVIGD